MRGREESPSTCWPRADRPSGVSQHNRGAAPESLPGWIVNVRTLLWRRPVLPRGRSLALRNQNHQLAVRLLRPRRPLALNWVFCVPVSFVPTVLSTPHPVGFPAERGRRTTSQANLDGPYELWVARSRRTPTLPYKGQSGSKAFCATLAECGTS